MESIGSSLRRPGVTRLRLTVITCVSAMVLAISGVLAVPSMASAQPLSTSQRSAGGISQFLGTLERAEQNALNTVIGQLAELQDQAAAGGTNNTVSTSSVQLELSFLGIDLANPANEGQIGIAITQVQDEMTAVSSRNQQLMTVLQELGAFG